MKKLKPGKDDKEVLKPNLDKMALTILLFLLTSFFFVLFFHPETIQAVWLLVLIPLYVTSSLLYQSLTKHSLLLKVFRWIVFTPLSIIILIMFVSQFAPDEPPKDFLVTHNFVDLSQVHRFTKYRACAGHQTVDQYSDEPISNMQHYFNTDPRIDTGQVKIYAPFDGYVLGNAPFTMADGITMIPKSGIPWWPFNQWRFSMAEGSRVLPQFQDPPIHEVKAGDLIGYLDSGDRYGNRNVGGHLRVGVTAIPPMFKNGNTEPYKKLDSVFNYMTDDVFAEYQEVIPGLQSREDMIITKEYRLAHPCKFKEGGPSFLDNPPYFETGPIEDLPLEEQDVYIGVRIDDIKGMNKARSCDDPEDIANNPECSN
ncbi:MAG: hypothetical protein HYS32_03475 [Candidatus Woesearchaeota archaeon]|nr:MAG: hypothetical protein HYS32_03475 [Candidatus Woesearchaeota archaeon]